MSYWDIRKRPKLNHLPQPDPELVRAGASDKDINYLRSKRWLELYHAEKAQPENTNGQDNDEEGFMAHRDASGGEGEYRD